MIYRYDSLKSKLDYNKNCINAAGDIILENTAILFNIQTIIIYFTFYPLLYIN